MLGPLSVNVRTMVGKCKEWQSIPVNAPGVIRKWLIEDWGFLRSTYFFFGLIFGTEFLRCNLNVICSHFDC